MSTSKAMTNNERREHVLHEWQVNGYEKHISNYVFFQFEKHVVCCSFGWKRVVIEKHVVCGSHEGNNSTHLRLFRSMEIQDCAENLCQNNVKGLRLHQIKTHIQNMLYSHLGRRQL